MTAAGPGSVTCRFVPGDGRDGHLEIRLHDRPTARLARVTLCHLPTPFEPMPRLTARLAGPRLFVKRDDCTGLAGGGNKARKLELVLADAVAGGAGAIVTWGALQSNHARQAAAAAAQLGLDCTLVLECRRPRADEAYRRSGNRLLASLLGASVQEVSSGTDMAEAARAVASRRGNGRPAVVIPGGASTPVGAAAYVACGVEIATQAREHGVSVDAIVLCVGSGGTLAGLAVATAYWDRPPLLVGVSSGSAGSMTHEAILDLAARTAAAVGLDAEVVRARAQVEVDRDVPVYGELDDLTRNVLTLVASLEGLILDPVYSGRAFTGLVRRVQASVFTSAHNVVFLHTGGTPGLYAYAAELQPADHKLSDRL